MPNKRKAKNSKVNDKKDTKRKVKLLTILTKISPHGGTLAFAVLLSGGFVQCFFNGYIISFLCNLLGDGRYMYLKNPSLVLGMASTIGLSMIVVFGFNFSKSVQQDYKGALRERGIENTKQAKNLEIGINYWQLLLLILLYICIVMDWFTLFYMLFAYDVLCYIVLITKLWLIKSVGVDYILKNYREMNQEHRQYEIDSILQNCVEDDRNINVRAINAYIEWLMIYLKENIENKDDDRYYEEKFYDEARRILNDSMDKLVLDKSVQSLLLISIIRQFCKKWSGIGIDKIEYQLFLAVLITYALNWEKNIDTDFICKEIVSWNDKSIELRYCIAVSRLEYLNVVTEEKCEVLLSNNIFYLYRPVTVKESYKDLIYLLWYLWSDEDKQYLTLHIKDMNRFIGFLHREIRIPDTGDTTNSLYMLVNGLKY